MERGEIKHIKIIPVIGGIEMTVLALLRQLQNVILI
jgi:hypothetical protein